MQESEYNRSMMKWHAGKKLLRPVIDEYFFKKKRPI